jgi:hypothetical protein
MESEEKYTKKRQVGKYIKVPIFDLEDGINVAKKISDFGGGRLDVKSLAESMGNTESTVMHHINSAKHHQIVENDKNIVKLTELGASILHPKSQEECETNTVNAFLSCNLYNRIYNRFKGKDLPPLDILANIFSRDEGVSFKTKDRTVSNFIQSGILVSLIDQDNGVYHCFESLEKKGNVISENLKKNESLESFVDTSKEIEGLKGNNVKNDKVTKISPNQNMIKISAEPFFELHINPDEKAFNALIQLLPFYKEVYCKKYEDSLQRKSPETEELS